MKNTIEKIYVVSEIHWDYDYEELKDNLAEECYFDSEKALIETANKMYNNPDDLADYLNIPAIIIIPDYTLKPYIEESNNTVDYAIVEYLSDTYGFCIKELVYDTYTI